MTTLALALVPQNQADAIERAALDAKRSKKAQSKTMAGKINSGKGPRASTSAARSLSPGEIWGSGGNQVGSSCTFG